MPQVLVDADWLARVMDTERHGCPFCRSMKPPIVRKAMEAGPRHHFAAQRGCLDCNEWWDPFKLLDGPLPED